MLMKYNILLLFAFFSTSNLFSQGSNCANAFASPITLPYVSIGAETTCGDGNNYNAANVQTCGNNSFTQSEEKLYVFTATLAGGVFLNLESPGIINTAVFIYEGCPDTGSCVAFNENITASKTLNFDVTVGKTYFIMIDKSSGAPRCVSGYTLNIAKPDPNCSKIVINAQNNAVNSDFELGNFASWQAAYGTCCPINTPSSGFKPNRHTITSGTSTDPRTDNVVTTVAPGGNFSARLGNQGDGAQAERLRYRFLVTPQTNGVIYKFAVVLQVPNPEHDAAAQPRFEAQVLDNLDNPVSCGFYKVVSTASIPCFSASTSGDVVYRDWSTVGIDLSDKIGQFVTIEFGVGDCSAGDHFGYAYLDAVVTSLQIEVSGDLCSGDTILTLSAPVGFTSYKWSTGDSTRSIQISEGSGKQTYTVTLTPVQGFDCSSVLSITIEPSTTPPTAAFTPPNAICEQDSIQFSDESIGNGKDIIAWAWEFGNGDSSRLQNPSYVYPTWGIYDVRLIVSSSGGCRDTIIKNVNVQPLPFSKFSYNYDDLTVSFFGSDSLGNNSYSWDFGDRSTPSLEKNPVHVYAQGGVFKVTLIVSNSCGTDTIMFHITIAEGVSGSGKTPDKDPALSIDNLESIRFKVFPNPVVDNLIVELPLTLDFSKGLYLRIFTNFGELVEQWPIDKPLINRNIEHLADGAYFIEILDGSKRYWEKIIVRK
ncbi:MAG: PKD repeat protein [Sphingobacteriales bacterium]|jgi:PKD repeat protein